MSNKRLVFLFSIIALALLARHTSALPDDNQQPINIQADRATQQSLDGSEKTEYFGNVVMTQGSLRVNADYVVLHSVDRKVSKIIANGEPARLQQQSDPQKPPVKARAHHIDYQLSTETITLTENAHIEQPDASFSGNHLKYNVATEEVIAEERVKMEFIPASKTAPADDQPASNQQPEAK